ncbi:hypothetical protein E6O75_ATG02498 [Venturia nashicola]|uniref:Uncharacterized protein n=1 Tax=Venturia nashicola TaxID=86259 RepID=A0A4Z1P579_9PEZI|nr:hypothetical protein E6O75_ATG02498 [Venturia nashicola]
MRSETSSFDVDGNVKYAEEIDNFINVGVNAFGIDFVTDQIVGIVAVLERVLDVSSSLDGQTTSVCLVAGERHEATEAFPVRKVLHYRFSKSMP